MSTCDSVSQPSSPDQWGLDASPISMQNSPFEEKDRLLSATGGYPLYTGQQYNSDDELLRVFRSELMPRLPFVLVSPDVTAGNLSASRPFLMSTIRLVGTLRSSHLVREQIGQIMSHIANNVLVRGERNMDLLLGILVVIGWYHYYQIQRSRLNSLLCLTESLITDLGLGQGNRPSGINSTMISNEERRALLGAWYLRSWYVFLPTYLNMAPSETLAVKVIIDITNLSCQQQPTA